MKQITGKTIPFLLCFIFFAVFVKQVQAQEIVTADRYMEILSERYAAINDYEAQIVIRSGSSDMTGNLSFLNPSFLRIDFTRPAEQVICFNGELMTVYLPEYRVVLNQEVTPQRSTGATGASLASAQGLILMRRNYIPSFVSGPDPIPLDEGSRELVVKIRLTRRVASEGFREIILSVNPDTRLIRRVEGRTIADALVRFDFTNIRTNLGIPPGRFIYDSPASANMVNNFLFRDTD
ncbi:MAG: outer membrane lipoprotein carrier protein LolA [Treponema sp.]|jgi:outer membrane lipoprotein-sorting protein|nr:outer membrane lipoprotein carrier protein LolA [Treponema sp.]